MLGEAKGLLLLLLVVFVRLGCGGRSAQLYRSTQLYCSFLGTQKAGVCPAVKLFTLLPCPNPAASWAAEFYSRERMEVVEGGVRGVGGWELGWTNF